MHGTCQELFEILDVDDGGQLTQDEFIDGLVNMFLQDSKFSTCFATVERAVKGSSGE